ncbi:MAG: toll/interleukin-1 receptor domain-containing protein [Thiotrichales bacterium]
MKVFLSHASETKALIKRLRAHLPSHIQVWLDEDELDLGVRFPHVIERAIREESDFVIVFLGEDALKSEWVEREMNWALEREQALRRGFLLPVLLDDVRDHYEAHPALKDRLYLECFDHSDAGLHLAAERLAQYLFAQVSRHFGLTRKPSRREFLDDLARDLTSYKEIAFRLHGALGDSLGVLARNPQAFNAVVQVVNDYNAFTETFIQRLGGHCQRVRDLWGSRLLAESCGELMRYIENDVYRGQVFALNEVRESIHRCDADRNLTPEEITRLDTEKDTLLATVRETLDVMKLKTSEFLAMLEKDL